jgi:hypothetical protein
MILTTYCVLLIHIQAVWNSNPNSYTIKNIEHIKSQGVGCVMSCKFISHFANKLKYFESIMHHLWLNWNIPIFVGFCSITITQYFAIFCNIFQYFDILCNFFIIQFVTANPNSHNPDTTWTQHWLLCQV